MTMINKEEFWNDKILGWEKRRYKTSGLFRSSIYHRLRNAEILLNDILTPPSSIIEFGCGSGRLAERLPDDVEYLGVDFSEKAIHEASVRFSSTTNKKFQLADITKLKTVWKSKIIVGLGFVDWITPMELEELLSHCESQWLILSYSKSSRGFWVLLYKLYSRYIFSSDYKPLFYSEDGIKAILERHNYFVKKEINSKGMLFGGLLLAEKKLL